MGRRTDARLCMLGVFMSKCGVCHKPRRTGTGSQAKLLSATGELRTVIACATCAKRGALVIAPAPPTFTTVESDDADVVKVLRALAKQLRTFARMAFILDPTSKQQDALIELGEIAMLKRDGLEQAADIAEAWAKERAARKAVDAPEQKRDTR